MCREEGRERERERERVFERRGCGGSWLEHGEGGRGGDSFHGWVCGGIMCVDRRWEGVGVRLINVYAPCGRVFF